MIRGSIEGVRPFISDVESVGRQSAARDRVLKPAAGSRLGQGG